MYTYFKIYSTFQVSQSFSLLYACQKSYQGSSHAQDVIEFFSIDQRYTTPHKTTAKQLRAGLH